MTLAITTNAYSAPGLRYTGDSNLNSVATVPSSETLTSSGSRVTSE